jgi:hypothetical protein
MTIAKRHPNSNGDGRPDTVIVRLDNKNRMVTKGYPKGVYDWGGGFG